MKQEKSTISSIVLLRAIAALAVCLAHIQMVINFKINKLVDYLFNQGNQGVAIFFVISGFILPYSLYKKQYQLKDFFAFLLKRSIRVDPPYWASIVIAFIFTPISLALLNLKSIFLHLTYLVPFTKSADWYNGVYWTLSIEFQFYILLGLGYPLLKKLPNYLSILILIALSVFCLRYTVRGIIIADLFQFVFGYLAFMAYVKMIDMRKFIIIFCLYTIYIVFTKSVISGVLPALTVLFIMLYKSNKNIPVFTFLGNISYSLYLVHTPVIYLILRLLNGYFTSLAIIFSSMLICFYISRLYI